MGEETQRYALFIQFSTLHPFFILYDYSKNFFGYINFNNLIMNLVLH